WSDFVATVCGRVAGLSQLAMRPLEALEAAHRSVAGFASRGDSEIAPAGLAATVYAALGQPVDAERILDLAFLSPIDRLAARVTLLEAGGTAGEVVSANVDAAFEVLRNTVGWPGGHPRVQARVRLDAARALELTGDFRGALELLAPIDALAVE